MRRIAKIAAAIISGTAAIAAEPFAEPPKQYSIVEVAHESRACRPAFSNNCITLKKGERVVVLAWQIDDNPRRGLYCLRPLNMGECYYADLTAIEIDVGQTARRKADHRGRLQGAAARHRGFEGHNDGSAYEISEMSRDGLRRTAFATL